MPAVRLTLTEEPGAQPVAPSLLHAPVSWLPTVEVEQALWTDRIVSKLPQVVKVTEPVQAGVNEYQVSK